MLKICVKNVVYIKFRVKINPPFSDGLPIRIYAYKHQIEHCKFALEVAVKSLEFFESWFGIKYPLSKCDFVSTNDHSAAAMENWGLIVHRYV